MQILSSTLIISLLTSSVEAWTTSSTSSSSSSAPVVQQRTELSRQAFLQSATAALVAGAASTLSPSLANAAETLPNGVTYEVQKSGKGPKPDLGELAAIRFAAYCGDTKIDDIFDTPEPYYTRVGSGGLIKGAEEALKYMQLGDRWRLTVPGELAFGKQGRPPSPGKPRIPSDATIIFDIEMVGIPGREPELIDLIGDV